MSERRVIGTTDEITTCDLCGREGLSHTVMIDYLDADGSPEGEINYYGSDCASKIFTGRKDAKLSRTIEREARAADKAKRETERDARHAASEVAAAKANAPFYAWIKATYGVSVANFGDIIDNSKAVGRKSPYTLKAEYARTAA